MLTLTVTLVKIPNKWTPESLSNCHQYHTMRGSLHISSHYWTSLAPWLRSWSRLVRKWDVSQLSLKNPGRGIMGMWSTESGLWKAVR